MNLHVIVLAGGKGTRFWPLSTPNKPKQFLRLFPSDGRFLSGRVSFSVASGSGHRDDPSLLWSAVERVLPLVGAERVWISTDEELAALSREELPHLPAQNFVIEPVARNTLPGIALACSRVRAVAPNAVIAVVCADHLVRAEEKFRQLLATAAEIAVENPCFVTFGIVPTRPETGYGYIRFAESTARSGGFQVYRVEGFTEKPNRSLAEAYIRDGRYLWNSGMFVWSLPMFFREVERHQPELAAQMTAIVEQPERLGEIYPQAAATSIDYGLMEHVNNLVVIPAEIGWDDVGSWESVWNVWKRDENDNAVLGVHIGSDTRNCLIFGGNKPIATVGLDNLIIVETDDALLICPRDRAQEVRELAARVAARTASEQE